jgi:hypothetical protein
VNKKEVGAVASSVPTAADRSCRACLFALLGGSALVRAALGFHFFGFLTGDDVEILESGFRRALGLLLLSTIHHKELRYLQGVIPFVSVLVAMGVVDLWRRGRTVATATLVALSIGWSVVHLHFLRAKSMPTVLAWDSRVHTFAATQLWAFGDRLFLGNGVDVRDIRYPKTRASDLDQASAGADRVALYERAVKDDPSLSAALRRDGFCLEARVA